jgi:hypothetical protein
MIESFNLFGSWLTLLCKGLGEEMIRKMSRGIDEACSIFRSTIPRDDHVATLVNGKNRTNCSSSRA